MIFQRSTRYRGNTGTLDAGSRCFTRGRALSARNGFTPRAFKNKRKLAKTLWILSTPKYRVIPRDVHGIQFAIYYWFVIYSTTAQVYLEPQGFRDWSSRVGVFSFFVFSRDWWEYAETASVLETPRDIGIFHDLILFCNKIISQQFWSIATVISKSKTEAHANI